MSRPIVRALILVGGCATGCKSSANATIVNPPPRPGCVISCPHGVLNHRQHLCRSDTRWFHDVLIERRNTIRAVDGTVASDTYQTSAGDYAVEDVEIGICSTVIAKIIAVRSVSERGVHPGEDNQGNPTPP